MYTYLYTSRFIHLVQMECTSHNRGLYIRINETSDFPLARFAVFHTPAYNSSFSVCFPSYLIAPEPVSSAFSRSHIT